MASLTDEIAAKASEGAKKAISGVIKGSEEKIKEKKNEIPKEHLIVKGVCLMLDKGVKFTTENVMKAVKEKILQKTGNIKYSNRNISIDELLKRGTVRKIDSAITGDVMRHFDAQCKKEGVKYSAMREDSDSQNPQYYIFYEGKSADVILHVMEQAYKSYIEEQNQQKQNQHSRDKTQDKEKNSGEEKESVRAKLAFFRDRVEERDREQDVKEKNKSFPEPSK